MRWKFDDPESPVVRHSVTITTRHSVTPAADPIVIGSETQTSVSQPNISLHDGEQYYVSVTACNAASLCSSKTSLHALLIDTSPPLTGIIKDHMMWNIRGSMTDIVVKWNGFTDAHSGIVQYIISIGTTYSGNQYTPSYIHTKHSGHTDSEQAMTVAISSHLISGARLYVSVWAINGVGLRSNQVQVSVISGSGNPTSGVLTIEKHSCAVTSCLGHCTCAPSSNLCDRRLYGQTCKEVNISTTSKLL